MYVVLVSVPVITPVVLLYDTAPAPLNLDLTSAVDNCVLVFVSVEDIVIIPVFADTDTLSPAVSDSTPELLISFEPLFDNPDTKLYVVFVSV